MSPQTLTPEPKVALTRVEQALQQAQVARVDHSLPVSLVICNTNPTPTGIIWQPAGPLEWLHLNSTPSKHLQPYFELVTFLIIKGQQRCLQLLGKEPQTIIIPYNNSQQSWLYANSTEWQVALANFPGQLECHHPASKRIQFANSASFIFPSVLKSQPISGAVTVFTDGPSNGKAAIRTPAQTLTKHTGHKSAQRVEHAAITWALQQFSHQPLNLYTDRHYVFSNCKAIETAYISSATTEELFHMFHQLKQAILARKQPLYVGHIRAHSDRPGPLSAGNAAADAAHSYRFPQFKLSLLHHYIQYKGPHGLTVSIIKMHSHLDTSSRLLGNRLDK